MPCTPRRPCQCERFCSRKAFGRVTKNIAVCQMRNGATWGDAIQGAVEARSLEFVKERGVSAEAVAASKLALDRNSSVTRDAEILVAVSIHQHEVAIDIGKVDMRFQAISHKEDGSDASAAPADSQPTRPRNGLPGSSGGRMLSDFVVLSIRPTRTSRGVEISAISTSMLDAAR